MIAERVSKILPKNIRKKEKQLKGYLVIATFIVVLLVFSLFILKIILDVTDYGISIASFAATLFMILRKPKSSLVSYKNLYGAYIIAAISALFAVKLGLETHFASGIGIITAFILMTALGMQHPPAIAMAVALILNKFSFWKTCAILAGIFLLIYISKTIYIILNDPKRIIHFIDIEDRSIDFNFREKKRDDYIVIK